jgi:hypothetical protein
MAAVPYSIAVSKLRPPFLPDFFIAVRLLRRREKFTEPDFALLARAFNRVIMGLPPIRMKLVGDVDPLTRPAPAGESAGSGPLSPLRGRGQLIFEGPRALHPFYLSS